LSALLIEAHRSQFLASAPPAVTGARSILHPLDERPPVVEQRAHFHIMGRRQVALRATPKGL